MPARRLHLLSAKFFLILFLTKICILYTLCNYYKEKLSVEQLESKFTSNPAEFPVLTADEYSHIKDVRTDAVAHFKVRLKVRHRERTDIKTFVLHIAGIFHQMPENEERGLISEMSAYIAAGGYTNVRRALETHRRFHHSTLPADYDGQNWQSPQSTVHPDW